GEDLVELHRATRLRERDHPAVGQLAAGGGAGLQVDVEVALEEQPRADLQLRVAVHRAAVVVDPHGHYGELRVAPAPDPLDLADVDARDPDRRARLEQVRV